MKTVAVRRRAKMYVNRQKNDRSKELSLRTVFWSAVAIVCLVGLTAIATVDVVGVMKETTKGQAVIFFGLIGCFALTYARYWWNRNVN